MIKGTTRSTYRRRESSRAFPAVVVAALLAVGALVYLVLGPARREPAPPVTSAALDAVPAESPVPDVSATPPAAVESVAEPPPVEPVAPLPALDESDPLIRELAADVAARPELRAWLGTSDLLRRFVAAVANLADGESPRQQLLFLAPKEPFRVIQQDDRIVADPRSHARYGVFADVFASLDAAAAVAVYRSAQPLFEAAYADLGIPERSFEETLRAAIQELLKAPSLEGAVALRRIGNYYEYPDEEIEGLSPAQRHLLRMGPRNVQRIQEKLREIQRALGAAAS